MDISFVNRITFKRELCYETIGGVFPKTLKVLTSMFGMLCIVFSFIVYHYGNVFLFAALLLLGIVLCFYVWFLLRIFSKSFYKQQVIINSGNEMQRTVEFADRIRCVHSNGAEWFFDYAQITHIYETKHLLILKISRTLSLPLDKSDFTVGNVGPFRDFVRKKCPSAPYTLRRFSTKE